MKLDEQKTILLVEDEFLLAMGQLMELEKYGYRVLTVNSGEKAIELYYKSRTTALEIETAYKKNAIDLVLMDIDLGTGIDGTQAAAIILNMYDVPIVFLSSHIEQEMVAKTEAITSYGYVVKNSSITVLDASIKMAFKLFASYMQIKSELNDKKKINRLLRVSETKYRRLFEATKEGILILDADNGMIVDVNPFMMNLLGYSYELFLGKAIWNIGFFGDLVGNKQKFNELKERNYARYDRFPLETASGEIIEVEFISAVYEVAHKKVIQCNVRDISERRRIEEQLARTRLQLEKTKMLAYETGEFAENIINTVREPLLVLDKDLRVVSVSRSFYDVFKVRSEDTIGQLIYELGDNQWDIPGLRVLLESILPQRAVFDNYEVTHDFVGIGPHVMLLNARQIERSRGQEKTILLAIEDITERKEAEGKIQSLLQEKDLILKEVHHRIKNNMCTIKSLLSLQADQLSNPAGSEALRDAESRVQSMMVLYDKLYRSVNFMEISMIEYLPTLIEEIVSNFPNRNMVTININIESFILDAKKTQSAGIILNELLTNIMKYAFLGRREGIITVTAFLLDGEVTLEIRDDGIGIPEEVNFDSSPGFGLLLVRTLTRQLRGSIGIERENGTAVILKFNV